MGIYNKPKAYNSDIQIYAMKSHYPQFTAIKKSKNNIEFTGILNVNPLFPNYKISVTYHATDKPIVKILEPKLVENPPHFYKASNSLCLYHPDNYKWQKDKLIAKEIMSWTAAWIYFYEVWLETNSWIGPEASHNKPKEPKND